MGHILTKKKTSFAGQSIDNALQKCIIDSGGIDMKKSTSISIRVTEEELEIFKKAAKLESYGSYSEFVRRTALKVASKIIKENDEERGVTENE